MTKLELATQIALRMNIETKHAAYFLETFCKVAKKTLLEGNEITLRTFGTLKPVVRAKKKGRHIQKNIEVDIPAQTVVKFVPSLEFKVDLKYCAN